MGGAGRIGGGLRIEKPFARQPARDVLAQAAFELGDAGHQFLPQGGAIGPGKLFFQIGQGKRR